MIDRVVHDLAKTVLDQRLHEPGQANVPDSQFAVIGLRDCVGNVLDELLLVCLWHDLESQCDNLRRLRLACVVTRLGIEPLLVDHGPDLLSQLGVTLLFLFLSQHPAHVRQRPCVVVIETGPDEILGSFLADEFPTSDFTSGQHVFAEPTFGDDVIILGQLPPDEVAENRVEF